MMKGKQLENSAMVGIWLLWIGTKGILIESWNSLAPKGLLEVILLYPTRPHPPAMSGDIFSEQRSGPFTFHAHQHKHAANLLYLFPFVTVSTAQPLALQICGVERTLCTPGGGSAAAARLRPPPLLSGWQRELPAAPPCPQRHPQGCGCEQRCAAAGTPAGPVLTTAHGSCSRPPDTAPHPGRRHFASSRPAARSASLSGACRRCSAAPARGTPPLAAGLPRPKPSAERKPRW